MRGTVLVSTVCPTNKFSMHDIEVYMYLYMSTHPLATRVLFIHVLYLLHL